MTAEPADGAWLEDAAGNRVPIRGSVALGRSASNQIMLPEDKVSRRHAVVQAQGEGEYWVVDFGSRNGTFLNGHRISHPSRLHHADTLRIGSYELHFRQAEGGRGTRTMAQSNQTVTDIVPARCWLLVADIMDSTRLAKELAPDELPRVTGEWLGDCKQTIEGAGGRINQFLGDGFFAFWRDRDGDEVAIARALEALCRLQAQSRPAFRFALHLGGVVLGGASLGEEQRISGPEVHFVFRMEKLAGTLGHLRLLSEPARDRLAAVVEAREAGSHVLAGFEQAARFYTFDVSMGVGSP